MPSTTITFPCGIGDRVTIADWPDIKGHVVGVCRRVWGNTICVAWWADGRRQEEWMHDWEVKLLPDEVSESDKESK